MKPLSRSLLGIAVFFYIVLAMPAVTLAVLLVTGGETTHGRIFGLACILAFPAPVLLWFSSFLKKRRRWHITAACLLVLAVILAVICYCMTPDGNGVAGSGVKSVFVGKTSYRRASIANLVPEIDQLKLGTYVFPRIDPFIDAKQGVRIRNLFLNVYRDMRQSDDFVQLGSVLGYVYRDMFLNSRPTGHLYQYVPPAEKDGSRLPVILFLHGSLGNFRGYLWVWKRFADKHGYAIVAPTFGAGNWFLDGGIEAVEQARQYCLNHPRMDGKRIILAGLSNGGTGVSRVAAQNPTAYQGLIFMSPVMESEIVSGEAFIKGWKGRRVFVLSGSEDRRIPIR